MKLSVSNLEAKKPLKIPGLKVIWLDNPVDIQTISNDVLEKIFHQRNFELDEVPREKETIKESVQSDYYKANKESLKEQIENKKFAILSGPTGTGKTTLAKTFAYESSLALYEFWADSEKTVDDFLREIKTYRKNNILQIKEIPSVLHKALVRWWVVLINEANSLSPDIQLALANMTESGFLVVWTKKIKIHPNFALIFTSNNSYAWTQEYNTAVVRKAWWLIDVSYEPSLDWEIRLVKTLYQKIRTQFEEVLDIREKDLENIAQIVRSIREKITKHNLDSQDFSDKIVSEDLNNFWDFFYIRFYETLLSNLLSFWIWTHNLKKEIEKLSFSFFQEHINWFWESHHNDKNVLQNILDDSIETGTISTEKASDKIYLDPTFFKMLKKAAKEAGREEEVDNYATTETTSSSSWANSNKPSFNPNRFRKVLRNEVSSEWKKLKRLENFYSFIENIHSKLVDSQNEKLIKNIHIKTLSSQEEVLAMEIDGKLLYFYNEKSSQLRDIHTEEDVKQYVFWNPDFVILLPPEWEKRDVSEMQISDFEQYENFLERKKSLELRKFSKVIHREEWGKKTVTFLGFSGELRDIRYEDEEWIFYIPNSKVNDILLSNYEVISYEDEAFKEKGDGTHFLILDENGKVEFTTKKKILEKTEKNITILSKIKDKDINNSLDEQIRKRFANIDKLNLHNGEVEKRETATPENIYGNAKPVSDKAMNLLLPSFWEIPKVSPSTKAILDDIEKQIKLWKDILLTGPSGVWKSTYATDIARRLNLPYISFEIDSNITEKTFLSNMKFNESEIENTYTPFLDFYINGWIVELKELNMADELTFLNNFLDKNWTITVDGQTYRRNPNFHIIVTRNSFDHRLFPWTNPINLATQARLANINIDYIKEIEEEREILMKYQEIREKSPIMEELWEDILRKYIEEILSKVVFPIRKKISELKASQDNATDTELQILSKKIITIDIFNKILSNSKNKQEIQEKLSKFFELSQEEFELLSDDMKDIFRVFNEYDIFFKNKYV